ncbi:hypothetical protein B0H11DRAFT_1984925, partial [Mycena galericulata]
MGISLTLNHHHPYPSTIHTIDLLPFSGYLVLSRRLPISATTRKLFYSKKDGSVGCCIRTCGAVIAQVGTLHTMDRLPNELLDRICLFLGKNELQGTLKVSSRLRSVSKLPFLSRMGISQSHIQAGTVSLTLSDSFDLILVVAHLCSIQRLVCFKEYIDNEPIAEHVYRRLVSILAEAPPIPDVKIYNKFDYLFERADRDELTLRLLTRRPQTATLLIIKGSTMLVSRPRSVPPLRWKELPPPSHSSSATKQFLDTILGYLVSAIINCGVVLAWTYKRLLRRGTWPQEERIAEDAGPWTGALGFDDWMRIQSLPGKLTLVTLTQLWGGSQFSIHPMTELTEAMHSSLLASLNFEEHLSELTVEPDTNLVYTELMSFVQRHAHLRLNHFSCGVKSIRPSSLVATAIPPNSKSKISTLNAPASYIPYLLPAAPHVQRIYIPFIPAPGTETPPARIAFDTAAYVRALDSIAVLPGTHSLTLSLAFRLTARNLPWHALPADAHTGPETRLFRVDEL